MRNGWLEASDVTELVDQVLDLIDPDSTLQRDIGERRVAALGSIASRTPRVIFDVRLFAASGQSMVHVDSGWPPAEALANLIVDLGATCEDGRYRGTWVPPCGPHDHAAKVELDAAAVLLRCPDSGTVVKILTPQTPPDGASPGAMPGLGRVRSSDE